MQQSESQGTASYSSKNHPNAAQLHCFWNIIILFGNFLIQDEVKATNRVTSISQSICPALEPNIPTLPAPGHRLWCRERRRGEVQSGIIVLWHRVTLSTLKQNGELSPVYSITALNPVTEAPTGGFAIGDIHLQHIDRIPRSLRTETSRVWYTERGDASYQCGPGLSPHRAPGLCGILCDGWCCAVRAWSPVVWRGSCWWERWTWQFWPSTAPHARAREGPGTGWWMSQCTAHLP